MALPSPGQIGPSFTRKRIDLTFTLGPKTDLRSGTTTPQLFSGAPPHNTITLKGLRASVAIMHAAGISQGALDLRVYGMKQSEMNDLFTISGQNVPIIGSSNIVVIEAGDDVTGMHSVWSGTIANAVADYNQAPDVPFQVQSMSAYKAATGLAPSTSFPGAVDAATVMHGLAAAMNLGFENNGVQVQLASPYFAGDLLTQAESCARQAGINFVIDNGTLAIWPRGGARNGITPVISAATGMVGYPKKTAQGVEVDILWNPSVVFGGTVEVQSINTPCNGTWQIYQLSHNLEAEVPDGQWFSHLVLVPTGSLAMNQLPFLAGV